MASCRVSSYFGCWSLERGARSIALVQIVQHVIGLIKCIINIELQFSSIDVIFRTAFNLDMVLLVATALGIIANGLLLCGVIKKKVAIIITWLFLEALSMIGIFVGLILVVKFATSPQLQEAIIDQAIANDPDVAHLYNRHHVAIWSWVLSGVFAFGLVLYTYFWIVVYSYYYELKNVKHAQDLEMEEMQSIASSESQKDSLSFP